MALVQSHFEFVLPVFLFLSYSFGIDTIKMFILARSSLENHTRFQTKNEQSVYPFSDQNGVYIREYSPLRVAGSISAATSALYEREKFELISPTGWKTL